jgi:prepilin-type N-terminal cleavage/methylation domain-containing protein
MTRRGLTLIELLVVFSIISLLLMIAFPALLNVRSQAQGAVCTQNTKTLSTAWFLYKDDNDDQLVNGNVGDSSEGAWVAAQAVLGNLESEKQGITRGALFRYVQKVDLYRCPGDQRKVGATQTVFRSYSIAGGANGEPPGKYGYIRAEKYSQIHRPASKYIFVEEARQALWRSASWVLDVKSRTWVSPLAVWHSRHRSALGYADGHAALHSWVDPSTLKMSETQQSSYPIPDGQGADVQFMVNGFPQAGGLSPSS